MGASPSGAQRTSLLSPAAVNDWNRMNQSFVPGYGIAGIYSETETDTSGREPERLAGMRVSPGYFRVMGMQPLRGRWFSDEEQKTINGPSVAILSYNFWTSRYGRSADVLEHHLVLGGVRYDIVGVMPKDFTSSKVDVWVPARTPDFLMHMREARFYSGVGRLRPGVTLAEAQADLNRVEAQIARQYPATEKGYGAEVSSLRITWWAAPAPPSGRRSRRWCCCCCWPSPISPG
jgi:putative ABC transport system permease protein